jgi:hypothetical protein
MDHGDDRDGILGMAVDDTVVAEDELSIGLRGILGN